ncbi:endospore germination permease [Cohnella sp. GCM10027633]|uniref:GerAB/ArcD/ProY family transporter n=1 Tax=unclassified Cohnella TaxID=2636738 RepID=UPI0036370247
MKPFDYADSRVGGREIAITVANVILGVGVLTLPSSLAQATRASDGWISILIAGGVAMLLAWVAAKLASRFPGKMFHEYAASIATKPVAIGLSWLFFVYFVCYGAYEARMIVTISKQYLFDQTPAEVIGLAFLFVTAYAVAGERIGLIRLNVLFLPIVLVVSTFVLSFAADLFEPSNLKPHFVTEPRGLLKGSSEVVFSFLGFELILFYAFMMRKPAKAVAMSLIGVLIPFVLYLAVYLVTIGVFTNEGAANIQYPTVELAKEIELPGQFFERFESVFFTIWLMTVFNTTSVALDISIMCLRSLFVALKKIAAISIVLPFIFIFGMLPQNVGETSTFGQWLSYFGFVLVAIVPMSLLLIAKAKGVGGNAG